jgi:hypothetical protein
MDRETFGREDQRLVDQLEQGVSRDFPNPERVGCPDSSVLRDIAYRKLGLAEVQQWLQHLGACSPCFQEFSGFRKEAANRRRRTYAIAGAAAVLIFAVAGWLWMRTQHPGQSTDTEVLDLRKVSAVRGETPIQPDERPLELHRWVKHLIVDLPFGSEEDEDEVALLNESGAPILGSSGNARLEGHDVVLRLDMDASKIPPGQYYLGLRHPGTEWTRYPVRVL